MKALFDRAMFQIADMMCCGQLTQMTEREKFRERLELALPEHAEELFKIVGAIEATRPFGDVRPVVMQMAARGTLDRDDLRALLEFAPAACLAVAKPSKLRDLEGTDSMAFLRRMYGVMTA